MDSSNNKTYRAAKASSIWMEAQIFVYVKSIIKLCIIEYYDNNWWTVMAACSRISRGGGDKHLLKTFLQIFCHSGIDLIKCNSTSSLSDEKKMCAPINIDDALSTLCVLLFVESSLGPNEKFSSPPH